MSYEEMFESLSRSEKLCTPWCRMKENVHSAFHTARTMNQAIRALERCDAQLGCENCLKSYINKKGN